ncbi:hypothetical protein R1sor_017678 [Riccia sorocarpa]|uniref:Uncharacterized protein n=1 Tax=Riccia sorocarpa TaxID=122646 RepID=A0ABD3IBI7_9MARC
MCEEREHNLHKYVELGEAKTLFSGVSIAFRDAFVETFAARTVKKTVDSTQRVELGDRTNRQGKENQDPKDSPIAKQHCPTVSAMDILANKNATQSAGNKQSNASPKKPLTREAKEVLSGKPKDPDSMQTNAQVDLGQRPIHVLNRAKTLPQHKLNQEPVSNMNGKTKRTEEEGERPPSYAKKEKTGEENSAEAQKRPKDDSKPRADEKRRPQEEKEPKLVSRNIFEVLEVEDDTEDENTEEIMDTEAQAGSSHKNPQQSGSKAAPAREVEREIAEERPMEMESSKEKRKREQKAETSSPKMQEDSSPMTDLSGGGTKDDSGDSHEGSTPPVDRSKRAVGSKGPRGTSRKPK